MDAATQDETEKYDCRPLSRIKESLVGVHETKMVERKAFMASDLSNLLIRFPS
jgi:hypothetical protein